MSERHWVLLTAVVALLAATVLLNACGDDDEPEADGTETTAEAGDRFIGSATPSEGAFVAVVASPPTDGTAEQEVTVYICDGTAGERIAELFEGTAHAGVLDLRSDGGARLEAELTADAASGTITLADGRKLDFEAGPASAAEGLYEVEIAKDGRITGTLVGAEGELEGQLPETEGVAQDLGTATAPGEEIALHADVENASAPASGRFIVTENHLVGSGEVTKRGAPVFRVCQMTSTRPRVPD